MPIRLIDSLGTTVELAVAFSDAGLLAAMLEFEVALARAQARIGLIPAEAARSIAQAASSAEFDSAALTSEARGQATVVIPFVKAFTALVRSLDPVSAGYVHLGATSQDVADTALVLILRRVQPVLARDHKRLCAALHRLSDEHSASVMLARTLLQPAPPITFGYKAAAWRGAIVRSWRDLSRAFGQALLLQFGGASGTLAAYADEALPLTDALGEELHLRVPSAPWHAHRDRLAAAVATCGIYTASLAKIVRDVSLLMQFEVGEAAEAGGGSSAMPHKRNPSQCSVALAAGVRMPGLVAGYLSGMVQEHERGAGGMQAEWQAIAAVIELTGSALAAVLNAIEGLTVDPVRMRANIASTQGAVFSEKASMLLAATHGRTAAQQMVAQALADGHPPSLLTAEQLERLNVPEDYLGACEVFRRRLLEDGEES